MSKILVLDSKGLEAKTKEQQDAAKEENDIKLREAILTAAEKEGLEASPDLIATAKLRFSFREDEVKALSIYTDITDFLKRHDHGAPKIKTVTQVVDERATKKKQLYDELCHYAEKGDMKAYRSCRSEYAQL